MEPPSSNVSGCWSSKEHELFLEAMKLFGKNWQKVSVFVGTRTSKQTRAHAQKFFEKIEKNCQKRDIQIRNKKAPVKKDKPIESNDAVVDSAVIGEHQKCDGGRWTAVEHELFLEGLELYNKDWQKVSELVKTRTVKQTRTHAQKYFEKLGRNQLYESSRSWMQLCQLKKTECGNVNGVVTSDFSRPNYDSAPVYGAIVSGEKTNEPYQSGLVSHRPTDLLPIYQVHESMCPSSVGCSSSLPYSCDSYLSCHSIAELNHSGHGIRFDLNGFEKPPHSFVDSTHMIQEAYVSSNRVEIVDATSVAPSNTADAVQLSTQHFDDDCVSFYDNFMTQVTGDELTQQKKRLRPDSASCYADTSDMCRCYRDLSFSNDLFLHDASIEVEEDM